LKPSDVDGLLTRRPSRDAIELTWGQPLSVISDCLRGFFVAKKGTVFVGADFSQIEARVLAWIAGEDRVLKLYRDGGDAYRDTASQIFRIPVENVNDDQRFIGKVAVLSLGYGGGVNAFVTMGQNYGLVLTEDEARPIVQGYRKTHPRIVGLWNEMEDAAVDAVRHSGCVRHPGPAKKGVRFVVNGSFLWMQLPSGRCICYPNPRVEGKTVSYNKTLGKAWFRTETWGGCLTENLVQAVARDLLADAIVRLEEANIPVVLHVHDEVVAEVIPEAVDRVLPIVKELPSWAAGLPIDAKVWTGPRYRK
jgi:DNA polymerase